MEIEYPAGMRRLDPDELEGLLIPSVRTQGDLDRWEQENILDALDWLDTGRTGDILTEQFVRKLHMKMFGKVWKWAGTFRTSGKNIGVSVGMIHEELAKLLGDARLWIEERPMTDDEIGAIFHYRFELIHPFSNGNGRHGRLMTDLLMERLLGAERFSWGGGNISRDIDIRARYIEALRAVDRSYDFGPLLEFVRS
jgi:Fic-DOC domain mobile mystery protein B